MFGVTLILLFKGNFSELQHMGDQCHSCFEC